jgi:hypothetical protein
MSTLGKRALRCVAPVAVVAAIGLAACGDGNEEHITTSAPKSAPSDASSPPTHCRWASRFGVHLEVGIAEITHCGRSEDASPARPSG